MHKVCADTVGIKTCYAQCVLNHRNAQMRNSLSVRAVEDHGTVAKIAKTTMDHVTPMNAIVVINPGTQPVNPHKMMVNLFSELELYRLIKFC